MTKQNFKRSPFLRVPLVSIYELPIAAKAFYQEEGKVSPKFCLNVFRIKAEDEEFAKNIKSSIKQFKKRV